MSVIGLISCVKMKQDSAVKAEYLYTSPLFLKSRAYIEERCDKWFILSAKYGLLAPDMLVEPYEETLKSKNKEERLEWADTVCNQLNSILDSCDQVVFLAGKSYREHLIPHIKKKGCEIDVPMRGLSIGVQLQWLTTHGRALKVGNDTTRFYSILDRLENGLRGKRILAECTGYQDWPQRGLYLFFEPDELRMDKSCLRVVRVGTHAVSTGSKSTLWNRLRTHRGTEEGKGNHRGSIFRLHVGSALSAQNTKLAISTWGKGQSAKAEIRKEEETLERAVSSTLGQTRLLWLDVHDTPSASCDRAYLERNMIGLLSCQDVKIDPPSENWLGSHSPRQIIRESGLWNLDHFQYPYESSFLEVLDEYVSITINEKPAPETSIAPKGWHGRQKDRTQRQLTLFE